MKTPPYKGHSGGCEPNDGPLGNPAEIPLALSGRQIRRPRRFIQNVGGCRRQGSVINVPCSGINNINT